MYKQFGSIIIGALCILLGLAVMGKAIAGEFSKNQHYITLDQPASPSPSITLFYSHYCAPCAMVHDPITQMANKLKIKMIEVPLSVGGPMAKEFQLAVAATKDMGELERFNHALIKQIHFTAQGAPNSIQELNTLLESCGINLDEYSKSCRANHQIPESFDQLAQDYNIRATPTIVVNGNKQISLQSLKSFGQLEALITELTQSV
ncbi:thioredoxin domain-containing protein [Agarivorans sp. JK6]|uniref:thioredoxin domain-containing protein n=1 Tax=Agarivorans sp. JK6 TaxID=2997426 RepID=UPI003872FF84